MAIDENKTGETGAEPPAAARPEAGDPQAGSGRSIVRVLQKRALMVRQIDLGKVRLGTGAKALQARAGPVAAETTALVKRRSSDAAVWLNRFGKENAAPRASGFMAWLKRRLHPRSLIADYRRLLLLLHNIFAGRGRESLFFIPTRGHVRSVRLSIPAQVRPGAHDYRPTPYKVFEWAMAGLAGEQALEDMTFVDFGAGRGRVLLLASHYPFGAIAGAEIAQELHDDCQMNIAQYPRSLMKCRNVTSLHLRATTVPIPEGPAAFYFFNPFSMDVFAKVLARITRSYKRGRRQMYLVCIGMDEAEAVEAQGIFHKVRLPLGQRAKIRLFSPYAISVYKTEG